MSAHGVIERCEGSNFRWEEGLSNTLASDYADYVDKVDEHGAWRAEHKGYVSSHCHVARDAHVCAQTFLPSNAAAHLREDLDNTVLLRLEALDRMAAQPGTKDVFDQFWTRFFNSQKDLRKPADRWAPSDETLADEFARVWNTEVRGQARPMFATFLNDFGGRLNEFVKTDWPHTLRDRLGLTHIGWDANPVPVALVCYELDEVRQARDANGRKGATASFARPTVLDSEMSPAFVPAPRFETGASYGHTLDLSLDPGEIPDSFSPELLTYPIAYQKRHIKALGFVSRAHAFDASTVAGKTRYLVARNAHVQGLRASRDAARSDFGGILA